LEIIQKLGLKKIIDVKVEIKKLDFYRGFSRRIDESDNLHLRTNTGVKIWVEKPNKNKYVGECGFNGFKIKRSASYREGKKNYPLLKGNIEELGDSTIVTVEINGLDRYNLIELGLKLLFFTAIINFISKLIPDLINIFLIIFLLVILIAHHLFKTKELVRLEENDIIREINYSIRK